MRSEGKGSRDWGVGFRVDGLGFRIDGLGFRVQGSGFRVDEGAVAEIVSASSLSFQPYTPHPDT